MGERRGRNRVGPGGLRGVGWGEATPRQARRGGGGTAAGSVALYLSSAAGSGPSRRPHGR